MEPRTPDQVVEELFRTLYALREGRNPAGVLQAVQHMLHLMAELRGVGLPADLGEFRPELAEDKSVRAIMADCQHLHHVEQTEPNTQPHVDERDRRAADGDPTYGNAMYSEAIQMFEALLVEAEQRGYRLGFEVN